jgi:hypothetical protein
MHKLLVIEVKGRIPEILQLFLLSQNVLDIEILWIFILFFQIIHLNLAKLSDLELFMMNKSNEGLQKLFFILCTDFTFLIYRSCIVFSVNISF